MTRKPKQYVLCLSNAGYPASLETRKLYPLVTDAAAEAEGMLRVVDESGEDYLYPSSRFARIDLDEAVLRRMRTKPSRLRRKRAARGQ